MTMKKRGKLKQKERKATEAQRYAKRPVRPRRYVNEDFTSVIGMALAAAARMFP